MFEEENHPARLIVQGSGRSLSVVFVKKMKMKIKVKMQEMSDVQ